MFAIILGLIGYVSWGVGDIFGAMSSRKIGATKTSFYVSIVGFILASIALLYIPHDFSTYTFELLIFNIFLSFFAILGNVSLNHGLRSKNPSIAGTIAGSFTALVVLFNAIFFKIPVSGLEWVIIGVILFGVCITSVRKDDLKKIHLNDKGVVFGICAMLGWAIYFTFIKIVIDKVGWFLPLYIILYFGIRFAFTPRRFCT
jgi:drug/metabolite transporter (DMT)-like permease